MRTSSLIVVFLVVTLAAPALADPQSDKKEANRHFKNGVSLFDENKYAEALAEFERAYTLMPHPLVLYNLANAHRALSQYDEAVTYYQRLLAEGPGEVDKKTLAKGKKELDDLMRMVAQVTISVEPADAAVTIDGKERAAGGAPLILAPGDHAVEARKDGHQPGRRAFRVAAGDKLTVELKLEVQPAEPPPDDGRVKPSDDPIPSVARRRRFGVGGAFGVNAIEAGETGAPVVGLRMAATDRIELGVDVVLVAYAAMPNARLRLAGSGFSVHAVAAVPIAFTDGDQSSTFAGIAGGLGARYRPSPALSITCEAMVSYAGEHGTTVPAFAGAELWF